MIFIDNLCEFLRLVIDYEVGGIFYPQNKEYINTSEMVSLIAKLHTKHMKLTKIFNLLIRFCQKKINLVDKVFGDYIYDQKMSEKENWNYYIADFDQSIYLSEK